MFQTQRIALAVCASALLSLATLPAAYGTPEESYGMDCAVCHNDATLDVLKVNVDEMNNAFLVQPGDTVQFSFDVILPTSSSFSGDEDGDGDDDDEDENGDEYEYILGISGLDQPGLNPILGSTWEHRAGESVSYVLTRDSDESGRYTIDVTVDASMAPGDYALSAVAAGEWETKTATGLESELKWSDTKQFVLRVGGTANIPEPSTLALLGLAGLGICCPRRRR